MHYTTDITRLVICPSTDPRDDNISTLLKYGKHSPGKVYKMFSTLSVLNFYCCIRSYHQHTGLKPLSFYDVMVSLGSNLIQCAWVLFSRLPPPHPHWNQGIGRLCPHLEAWLRKGPLSSSPIWLMECIYWRLQVACFFKSNKGKSLRFLELLTSRNS